MLVSVPRPAHPVAAGDVRFDGRALALIAGPCVIEDEALVLETAAELKRIASGHGLGLVFKASYAKDNRSAGDSYRGPGPAEGLRVLDRVRSRVGVPVLSDVHLPGEVPAAAAALDVLQIPAFLCRQTSLLEAAGRSGRPVNIKKGQFMAPAHRAGGAEKVARAGGGEVLLTERGAAFGYHNLVVDMRSFAIMARTGRPVVYDITHSLQLPGSGKETGGAREHALPLARAAVAAGAHAVFFEAHPDPDRALSDRATQLPLADVPALVDALARVWAAVHAGEA